MKEKLIKLLATGFGFGYAPRASGTLGSLWGVLFFYLLKDQSRFYLFFLAVAVTAVGIGISGKAEVLFKKKDSGFIVIDEVAGQLITYLFISYSLTNLILGFIFFRLFDVIKLFPANRAQAKLPGGWGVMMDDVVAGVQAGLVLLILNLVRTHV